MIHAADIAAAVTKLINEGSYSQSFTAVRSYLVVRQLEEGSDLRVTVVPAEWSLEPIDRRDDRQSVAVDVAVQKRLTASESDMAATLSELDGLVLLVEQIADFVNRKHLDGLDAAWEGAENDPPYIIEHLEQMRQFTSVLTLRYRAVD